MSSKDMSGHPRTRGARSSFQQESNFSDDYAVRFGTIPGFDGSPIFYCSEGKGPPLVFVYGIACSSLHWTYQIDYFREHYQCIWFDYRGHRKSPIPDNLDTLNIESSVKDLKCVLDFLEVKEAVFLGHSMGVSVSLEFARVYPEMVKMLVLANGTARKPLETLFGGNLLQPAFWLLSKFQRERPELISAGWKIQEKTKFVGQMLGVLGFNRNLVHPHDVLTYGKQMAELPPVVLTRMMDDYQHFDATSWLHEIQQKTLILSGDIDQVTPPKTQDLIQQLMPNSELIRVQHGSHCSTLDMPDYVNLLIERFLLRNSYR
jgi:pimeloyl-ACP methyl ester carboxylesterase